MVLVGRLIDLCRCGPDGVVQLAAVDDSQQFVAVGADGWCIGDRFLFCARHGQVAHGVRCGQFAADGREQRVR